jgi:hypothetical protein
MNRFEIVADIVYEDYANTRDFETCIVKFFHILIKLLVFYLGENNENK